ncbi:MAG: ATP-grasp domain-containing protein [Candidatus Omnitrophota bacterium]|nr:ATP-grasp domain-containing protein [Candidatus Omnitrophota bacterium]
MRGKTILITGVGGDIGQSIIKCLKDNNTDRKIKIVGCDIDRYAASRQEVDSFLVAPFVDQEDKYVEFIKSIVKKEKIDYLIPTTEQEIIVLDKRRASFDGECKLLINPSYIINTFFDKYATVEFLRNNGLPCPRTYRIEDYSGELSFPLIFKPRFGCGSKGLTIAHDRDELDFLKKSKKDFIIQEVVGDIDEEYTACVFSNGQDIHSIAFKRSLGYGSLSKIAELSNDVELLDLAKKIACAIDLRGSINIQVRKTVQGYIPFEINPRFSSTVYIRHYFGFRDVEWWLNLCEGRQITYTLQYKSGVGVRKLGEIFFECQPF